jgi:hypothetical protein
MNWGQAANFLWGWQVQFYGSMLLAGTVVVLIARAETPPKLSLAVAAGSCVVLLPLFGANGLALVPALALWLGYTAVLHWRTTTREGRRGAIVLVLFAVLAVLLVGLYFVGYNKVPYFAVTYALTQRDARRQFLTMGFDLALSD